MDRSLYPDDWDQIAYAIKDACAWQCQVCGLQCRRPGEPFDTQRRTLTVAHWQHDYTSAHTFVVACCPKCHNRHDAYVRWINRRRRARARQLEAGQTNFGF